MITQSFMNWVGVRYGEAEQEDFKIKPIDGYEYTTASNVVVSNNNSSSVETHVIYAKNYYDEPTLSQILTSVSAVSSGSDPDLATIGLYNGSVPLLVLGTGTTPATVNDYTMEQPIYTMKCSTISRTPIKDNDAIIGYQSVITFSNQTENDVTFSEIGIIASLPNLLRNGSNTSKNVLIEHTILTTPVTVAPNDTVNILYKITF